MSYQSELSVRNRGGRLLWGAVQATLFRLAPRPCHAWRRFWLRCFGATIGPDCAIYGSARIWAPWNLVMDEGSCLGDRVDCYNVASIRLGAGAMVSQDACLCAATHDYESPAFTLLPKPILLHAGTWVCARAFIGPGVTVGNAAVVGACAVVFKDVPAQAVVAGNPAKFIKSRDRSAFPVQHSD